MRSDGPERCILRVLVVPHAQSTAVLGPHGGALKMRLAALPVEGRANLALCAWLAEALGLPKRAVSIQRGEHARAKQVSIAAPAATVSAWLARIARCGADADLSP